MNAEDARVARRKVLDMIVADKVMAGGFHFPFPAFGRVEKLVTASSYKPVADSPATQSSPAGAMLVGTFCTGITR